MDNVLSELSWSFNIELFHTAMIEKIMGNYPEKGISWRSMTVEELHALMEKFIRRYDYESIACIAFMLWENNNLPENKAYIEK